MKITYAITCNDELDELKRLYEVLSKYKRPEDQILIQQDSNDGIYLGLPDFKVEEYCMHLARMQDITYIPFPLDDHFADFKNNLNEHATGDFIFQIDADEIPMISLITSLPDIIEMNPTVDLYVVPRVNTVEGLTIDHVNKWGWNVNGDGWVNFPDYQMRIYRNTPDIKWKNKVHEVLEGFKEYVLLPKESAYSLHHPKSIEKQEKQNEFYEKL